MTEKMKKYEAKMPLLTDQEIRDIDNCRNEIVDKFTKMFIHDKDLAIAQHIIQNQQEEIEKYKYLYEKALSNLVRADKRSLNKEKTIDLIARELYLFNTLNCDYKEFKDIKCKTNEPNKEICKECIKQYFEKKAEDKTDD